MNRCSDFILVEIANVGLKNWPETKIGNKFVDGVGISSYLLPM